jgi:hypothetical protein
MKTTATERSPVDLAISIDQPQLIALAPSTRNCRDSRNFYITVGEFVVTFAFGHIKALWLSEIWHTNAIPRFERVLPEG